MTEINVFSLITVFSLTHFIILCVWLYYPSALYDSLKLVGYLFNLVNFNLLINSYYARNPTFETFLVLTHTHTIHIITYVKYMQHTHIYVFMCTWAHTLK